MASESGDITDMEVFYASVRTRPCEETQKALKILQGLLSKKFSLLLHPGRSIVMKDTLKYLLTLAPEEEDEGFCMTTKSAILQLSQCFAHWSLHYDNASIKLVDKTENTEKAEKMKGDVEANIEDFHEMDKEGKSLSHELAQLLEDKRDLEHKISAVKTKIANCTEKIDNVVKKKVKLFHEGRVVKAEWNDLRRLKAEQELAKITQANIEAEWLKLVAQFNTCVALEKWI